MRFSPRSSLRWIVPALLVLAASMAACGGGAATDVPTDPGPSATTPAPTATSPGPSREVPQPSSPAPDQAAGDPLIQARPYASRVPAGYGAETPLPLVIVLHGYGTSGAVADKLFGFGTILDERGFLLAMPDRTPDRNGLRFWSATDACCGFDRTDVDDVAYLEAVIDDMSARYVVDPKRTFIAGHSNGGFMAHRLACDLSDQIAAIVSLAGAVWADRSSCQPTGPVAVAELHGTADRLIRFDGGTLAGIPYPGAAQTVATWATKLGCSVATEAAPRRLDLDVLVAGSETTVTRHADCPAGAVAELWTLTGTGHSPLPTTDWTLVLYDFLDAHPKL